MCQISYVGLGANLADPIENILSAVSLLGQMRGVNSIKRSSLYISSPVGYASQDEFVNCVVQLELNAGNVDQYSEMQAFFSGLQAIEQKLGRQRDKALANGPRKIDCDLLFFGDLKSDNDSLTVPHPRAHERLFVLLPLQELNADVLLANGNSVNQQLAVGQFAGQQIYRLGDALNEPIA